MAHLLSEAREHAPRFTVRLAIPVGEFFLLTAVLFLGVLLAACGGSTRLRADTQLMLTMPDRLTVPASASDIAGIELTETEDVTSAYAEVMNQLADAGHEPFDPARANQTGPAHSFAWYLTFQEDLGSYRAHHVVYVCPRTWTVDRVDRFIQAYFSMPAGTPRESGAPIFHFVADEPPPYAIDYLFGNEWYGALESALLIDFLDLTDAPGDAPYYAEFTRERLEEFGLVWDDRDTLAAMDFLLDSLPRPSGESTYYPVATLVGIGAVLGEHLRAQDEALAWVDGDGPMATMFALEATDVPGSFLRPVDFLVQAYRSSLPLAVSRYVELAETRLDDLRD